MTNLNTSPFNDYQTNTRSLARCLTMIENELEGYETFLASLPAGDTPVIGFTGPPGAGKSSLISALANLLVANRKKVAIIAIDPSSPFNKGALMGDRVRMSEHFLNPDVFIRSMATRGSLGGLSPKIIEAIELLKTASFDYIFIETVGVGQSEVEIASLADTTVLVLVPEAGDEIQTIKSGIMEIADIFVLNKSDRDGAATFYKNLKALAHNHATSDWEAAVIKTVATKNEGIEPLFQSIQQHIQLAIESPNKAILLAEKAISLIKNKRTQDLQFETMVAQIKALLIQKNFNLFQFVHQYTN